MGACTRATAAQKVEQDMIKEHIVSAFDRDLEHIQGLVLRMGGLVEVALRDSVIALETGDLELAAQVRDGDRQIDELEERIRAEVERLIALRAPTASDLRTVMSVLSISNVLERCGDYARNIAKRTQILEEFQYASTLTGTLRRMSRHVEAMISDALDSYVHRDVERAEDVIARDLEADQMYNSLFRELLTHMMEDPHVISHCMHLHFIAKNIERAGDHATNLAEQTIYLVTGHLPDEDRPKQDLSSISMPRRDHG